MLTQEQLQAIYIFENLTLAQKMYQELCNEHRPCIDALRMARLAIVESHDQDKGFNEASLIETLEAQEVDELYIRVCQKVFNSFFDFEQVICLADIENVELHLLRKQYRMKYDIQLKNARSLY